MEMEMEMEMGDGDGMGWVGGSIIIALWANALNTLVAVCRSICGMYNNHASPGL